MMENQKISFSFGRNWQSFVDHHLTPERLEISRRCLLDFLGREDLRGSTFLDVGCGSGLSSLAAFDAGAERVLSFDVDPFSVATTRKLREMRGDPEHWRVLRGSVLDEGFLSGLEPAELVYSWGVLHHTGSMWRAIENASRLIGPGGVFFIALYTTDADSAYWLEVKKRYNRAGRLGKLSMEAQYVWRHLLVYHLRKRRDPLKYVREYKAKRGMSYLVDVRDWLGGYPFEHATPEEVIAFCKQRLGLELIKVKTGEANTEYLFRQADLRA